ncbi:MAG: hypothetical protein PHW56_04795 [Methanosarcinaceae archaeon]|nr:hypothetical protein [Methanosarcinaceae archaeon]
MKGKNPPHKHRNFSGDETAWADFLLSKAALILASFVLFAALFQLAAGFREVESQEALEGLARDFKAAVDEAGTGNFQEGAESGPETFFYYFNENFPVRERGNTGPLLDRELEVRVSGEYVRLDSGLDGKPLRAVKPFTFLTLPLDEVKLREKLRARFGAEGTKERPVSADYTEVGKFLSELGQETVLDPEEAVCIRKEFIYVKENEEVSVLGCTLVYQ